MLFTIFDRFWLLVLLMWPSHIVVLAAHLPDQSLRCSIRLLVLAFARLFFLRFSNVVSREVYKSLNCKFVNFGVFDLVCYDLGQLFRTTLFSVGSVKLKNLILHGLVEIKVLQLFVLLLEGLQLVHRVRFLQLGVFPQSSKFVFEPLEECQNQLFVLLGYVLEEPSAVELLLEAGRSFLDGLFGLLLNPTRV